MNLFSKQKQAYRHGKQTQVYERGKGVEEGLIRSLGLVDTRYYTQSR